MMALFDPYYYVSEKLLSQRNEAYQYFSKIPTCNNIVGDYRGAHKYLTNVNGKIERAIADCLGPTLVQLIRLYITKAKVVELKVITQRTFEMALKLLLISVRSTPDLSHFKESLPRALILSADNGDPKLKEILEFLADQIHGSSAKKEPENQEMTINDEPS